MDLRLKVVSLLVAAFAVATTPCHAVAQSADWQSTNTAELLEKSRPRLVGIYEKGVMRAKRFEAEWLADSSGYVVREKDADTNELVRAVYQVDSGERSVASAEVATAKQDPLVSPDGKQVLQKRRRNWIVREIESGKTRRLFDDEPFGDVSYRELGWSPDGSRVLLLKQIRARFGCGTCWFPMTLRIPACSRLDSLVWGRKSLNCEWAWSMWSAMTLVR